ncbi:DUF4238 domain-containing protein [Microvirga tunisiensis]|uniref:DUF4238 domain-containing protein n=1 Tax=Microvirga tunisiensis TaxID=2108360 RepID=A0A5N7MMD0_9HYPH|nr:DUF4238 domain-containing protein [Microvirga tunisiensis]MPR09851.1 DUF4238 domain-containing protein [Microvirga tunisiensis]MPR28043.1 DUF4238 domain-containing protein [Microvirga tunisiensis]
MGKFHHYVPVHHQKRWLRPGARRPEVFLFKKNSGKFFGSDVRNVLGEDHLYSLVGSVDPDPHLEDAVFGQVDAVPSSIVTRLQFDEKYRLTSQDKRDLAIFLVASVFRTPWGLASLRTQVREAVEKSLATHTGVSLDGIDFVTDDCRERFLNNDKDYIRRNAPLVAVCNHILTSKQTQEISAWPYVIMRLRKPNLSFVTSDTILLMYGKGKSKVHVAPLTPRICLVSATDPADLVALTSNEGRFCRAVNKLMWEKSLHSVVGFPTAPYLNTLGFVRGDGNRP